MLSKYIKPGTKSLASVDDYRASRRGLTLKDIIYIPKPITVEEFGCPDEAYFAKWVPEICGVCCFKMIGDTFLATQHTNLWQLTESCIENGAFEESQDGTINGIFYKPLLALAKQYKLSGKIFRWLPLFRVRYLLAKGLNPILSIDLHKLDEKYEAGHLIIIVAYDSVNKEFIVHDPSSVLDRPGINIRIGSKKLRRLSNKKGLAFSKEGSNPA